MVDIMSLKNNWVATDKFRAEDANAVADAVNATASALALKADATTTMAATLSTTVYVADNANSNVYRLLPDGTQSTLPITGLNTPLDLALDNSGILYIANTSANNIIRFDINAGTQTAIAIPFGSSSVAVDKEGNIYFSYGSICRKRTVAGVVTTLGFSGIGSNVRGITVDKQGSVYINDITNLKVWKLTSAGIQSQVLFTGLSAPWDIVVDDAMNVYVADASVGIQMLTPAGVQSTLAPAAGLGNPLSITVDAYGNRYFSTAPTKRVYRIDTDGVRTEVGFANGSFGSLSGIAVSAVPTHVPGKLVLKSPNGTVYSLAVDDNGVHTGMTIDGGRA